MVWLTATLQNRTDTSFLLTPENAKVRFIFHGRDIDPGELFQLRGEPLKAMDYTVDKAVHFCPEVPESPVEESHAVTIQLGFNEPFDEYAGRQSWRGAAVPVSADGGPAPIKRNPQKSTPRNRRVVRRYYWIFAGAAWPTGHAVSCFISSSTGKKPTRS